MIRLALPLLVLVAACDTAAPEAPGEPSALVGRWTAVVTVQETRATSRTAQSVPDFSAAGEGAVVFSGDATGGLSYVGVVETRSDLQLVNLSGLDPQAIPAGDNPLLEVRRDANGASATLNLNRGTPGQDIFTGAFPSGTAPFSYAAGRLTVPDLTLTADDGSARQVRLGGALTFPTVAMPAGQAVTVRTRRVPAAEAVVLTIHADGTYRRTGDGGGDGTWTERDGRLTLSGPFGATTVQAEVDGSTLRLTQTADDGCTGECVGSVEAGLFAAPGSFTGVEFRQVASYRRS